MSEIFTIPYTKIQILAKGDIPAKIVYAPILKTFLFKGNENPLFSFESIVDSGADFCVFPAELGKLIGLDIYAGDPVPSKGVGGTETLYFHSVKVGVIVENEMLRFKCRAGFSTKMNTGLLGRTGFFDIFNEIYFNQKTRMFRLKGGDIKSEKTDFLYE